MSDATSKLIIKTIPLLGALLLTGCTNINKVTRSYSLFPPNTQDELLFADIELTNGSYRLINVSSESQDVRLNDMSPMEINYEDDKCRVGILGLTDGDCKSINSPWVYNKFNYGVFPPTDWLFSLLFMWSDFENYDSFILPLNYIQTFDEEKFKKAIEEAQKNDQISQTYPQIFTRYTSLYRSIKSYQTPTVSFQQYDFEGLANRELLAQQDLVKKHLMTRLKVKLNDPTSRYNGALPTSQYFFDVEVKTQAGIPTFDRLPPIIIEDPQPVLSSLLPSKDLREFEQKLQIAENKFSDIREENEKAAHVPSQEFKSVVKSNTERLNVFRQRLAMEPYSVIWKEKGGASYLIEGYNYTLMPPDLSRFSIKDDTVQPTAVLTILGMTEARSWPRELEISLDQISIKSNEDSLNFTNHYAQDIDVYGLTLSVADQSTEISDKDSLLFQLPSQASHQIYLTALDLKPLTQENAQFTSSTNRTDTVKVGAKLVFKHLGSGEMQTLERHTYVPVDLFY